MSHAVTETGLVTHTDLRAFFQTSVERAITNQQVPAREGTVHYVVNLLTDYARSERLFDYTEGGLRLQPLAWLYAAAHEAPTEGERRQFLRRLGDVALFVAGLFSGMLARKLVDTDYYIAMGGAAYGYLGDGDGSPRLARGPTEAFRQLSRDFARFVDVLAEVGEQSPGSRDQDLLRTYELWARSGSPRLERRLRAAGITPVPPSLTAQ